jgi:hypothetical protein
VWATVLNSNSPQWAHLTELSLHWDHLKSLYTLQPKAAIQWWILHYDNVILFFNIVFSEVRFNPEVSQNSSFLPLHNTSYRIIQSWVFVWSEKSCSMYLWLTCTSYTHTRKCGFWYWRWHILWAVTTDRHPQGKDGNDSFSFLNIRLQFLLCHISSQYIPAYQTHSFSALGTAIPISETIFILLLICGRKVE